MRAMAAAGSAARGPSGCNRNRAARTRGGICSACWPRRRQAATRATSALVRTGSNVRAQICLCMRCGFVN
uniref:Uncharacterized protein n=1 Tax=Arundo donax TaxID=35708 RepID=A0A0A9ASD3_ARUDO